MSELARQIRREIEGTTENPLVMIGLAPHIIDLGLSKDDLFEYVTKDVARRLVMRFHPDRARGPQETFQRRYADAYERLQDREAFDRALADFRESRTRRVMDAALATEKQQRDQRDTVALHTAARDARAAAVAAEARLRLVQQRAAAHQAAYHRIARELKIKQDAPARTLKFLQLARQRLGAQKARATKYWRQMKTLRRLVKQLRMDIAQLHKERVP